MIPERSPVAVSKPDWPLLLLLGVGLLLRLGLAWAPFPYLARRGPLVDDAFYGLSIARNLAAGAGPTADGIHATSGFQPLFTLLLVPVYALLPSDPLLPIHLALTVLALCGAAAGGIVFRLVRRVASRPAALFSLSLWTFSPYFLSQGANGLETGLFGLCLLATLDQYLGAARMCPSFSALARLGFLLGLTILARIDGVLVAGALAFDLLRLPLSRRERLHRLAVVAGATLLTTAPYLLFLLVRFGSILPDSAGATRYLSLCYGTRFTFGASSASFFSPEAVPWIYYLGSLRKAIQTLLTEPLLFPVSPFLCLASLFGWFHPRAFLRIATGGFLLVANVLALGRGAGVGGDSLRALLRVGAVSAALWIPTYAFGVLGPWWFGRYFYPLFLLMTVFSGPALDRLGEGIALFRQIGSHRFAFAALALHLVLFAAQMPAEFFLPRPNRNIAEYLEAARYLDEVLPPGARAGAFQSGTLGYFARRRVVNLDGVVNGDAARALREKRVADYVRREGIEAVIDWPWILDALLVRRSPEGAAQSLGPSRPVGPFVLVRISGSGYRLASAPAQK